MARSLLISIRFHDSRYHGAGHWPPSSARLFQALVAAACNPELDMVRRDALMWLEKLAAPSIAAPAAHLGQHVGLFVPNNDLDAMGGDIRRLPEIRSATKHIRPKLFDAAVPLHYIWRFDGGTENEAIAGRVREIAEGLYQLGRGVDMAWAVGEVLDEGAAEARLTEYPGIVYRPSPFSNEGTVLDCPEPGSLSSLETRFKASATRFRRVATARPGSSLPTPLSHASVRLPITARRPGGFSTLDAQRLRARRLLPGH